MLEFKDYLEIVNHVTVIGGVVWAIVQWPKARKQRKETERDQSYAALNDHFLKFLELHVQAPGLGTAATDRERIWDRLSANERAQQRVLLDFLSSILERAFYFLDADVAPTKTFASRNDKRSDWTTWQNWIDGYARNPNFVAFWNHLDETGDASSYGREFVQHVRGQIALFEIDARALT